MLSSILVLGAGGREHAVATRLLEDESIKEVYVMPGNPGMSSNPRIICVEGDIGNFSLVAKVSKERSIDLIIVGPEEPLANGIVDYFKDFNISILGPDQNCAKLESSKAFSKDFMKEFNIPTAQYKVFDSYIEAKKDLETNQLWNSGVVVKASSLAAGKGVFVCENKQDGLSALYNIMENERFSVKTETVVLEQILKGKELSSFALCDGESFISLGSACDHKRLLDNDLGPNTGGMGTYTPGQWPSKEVQNKIDTLVFQKVIDGMKKRGTPFTGILFAGLIIDKDDIQVIEFNVRFGDPEAQVLMPTLNGNLSQSFKDAADHKLNVQNNDISLSNDVAVHIVKVSKGYPALEGNTMLENQKIIKGEKFSETNNDYLYFAGVSEKNGSLVNSGGRVLGVTSIAKTLEEARSKAYKNIGHISFEGEFWRKDIGNK